MEKIKNLPSKLLTGLKVLAVLVVSASVLSSCLKTYVDPKIAASAHTVFVNTIPDGSYYSFYIENFRASNQDIAYSFALPYIYVTSGPKKVDLVLRNGMAVLTDTIVFKAAYYYTIFTTQQVDPEFVVLEDAPSDLVNPPVGKAKIRLVNLSPDAPNIDLFIDGGNDLINNIAYKENSAFIVAEPAVYTLNFRETGTNVTKYKKRIVLEPNKLYTLFSLGLWNSVPGYPELDMGLISGRD